MSQLKMARQIAIDVGVTLKEVDTKEGTSDVYIENKGMSCYSCKTHLYTELNNIKAHLYDDGG